MDSSFVRASFDHIVGAGEQRRRHGEAVRLRGFETRGVSLDHLIGEGEERVRDGQPDRPGGLEIEDQFELRGLFHG